LAIQKDILCIILVVLLSLAICLNIQHVLASATIGFQVGDWAEYSISIEWSSNITDPKPPIGMENDVNVSSYGFNVSIVLEPEAYVDTWLDYTNGTKITRSGHMNIETGIGYEFGSFLIRSGLEKGSIIYTDYRIQGFVVTDIVLRNCYGQMRETVFLNLTKPEDPQSFSHLIPYQVDSANMTTEAYWDKETGIATKFSVCVNAIVVQEQQTFFYNVEMAYDILGSSQPIIPEFPPFFILPLFMIATLLAVIVYERKHQTRNKKREV